MSDVAKPELEVPAEPKIDENEDLDIDSDEYKETEEEFDKLDAERREEVITTLPQTKQLYFNHMANYCTQVEVDHVYHMYMAITILRGDSNVGDKPLMQTYGSKYEDVAKRLYNLGKNLTNAKIFYDKMTQRDVDRDDISNVMFRMYRQAMLNVPINILLLADALNVMVNSTDLKWMRIPNNAFVDAKSTYKKVKIDDKEAVTYTDKMIMKRLEKERQAILKKRK